MSDGCPTVTALVTDIVRQIFRTYDEWILWTDDKGLRVHTTGVVLIDQIDAHLHVSWQKRIGPWLLEHFPNIQFIVTTQPVHLSERLAGRAPPASRTRRRLSAPVRRRRRLPACGQRKR